MPVKAKKNPPAPKAKAKSGIERRVWIRAKRVLSIQVRLVKSKRKNFDPSWHLTTTYDMSLGGVAFYSDREYLIGETLEVHVIMSGILEIFKGLVEVVRVERKITGSHYLVAVKFQNPKIKPSFPYIPEPSKLTSSKSKK